MLLSSKQGGGFLDETCVTIQMKLLSSIFMWAILSFLYYLNPYYANSEVGARSKEKKRCVSPGKLLSCTNKTLLIS